MKLEQRSQLQMIHTLQLMYRRRKACGDFWMDGEENTVVGDRDCVDIGGEQWSVLVYQLKVIAHLS